MEGSCNCKSVTYASSGDVKAIVNCHCNLCRKMNGSAFSTYVVVPDESFELISGEVKTVKVSEHASRSHCIECGTPIFNENPKLAGLKILYLGSVDTPGDLKPTLNIFCESQVDWINDIQGLMSLPQGAR